MPYRESRINRTTLLFGITIIGLALSFLILFWTELGHTLLLFRNALRLVTGSPPLGVPSEARRSVLIITFNIFIGFGFTFFLWTFLVSSKALLPVSNLQEVLRTTYHLLLHIFKLHGQAVFIDGGVQKITIDDIDAKGPGVVLADNNSAVVLEEAIQPPGLVRYLLDLFLQVVNLSGLSDSYDSPRAKGTGIVFTRWSERIRGAADLRKQTRFQENVYCFTKDGIEMKANGLFIVFSLGQAPQTLQLAYQGERNKEHLQPVRVTTTSDGKIRIEGVSPEELDDADRSQIDQEINEWSTDQHLNNLNRQPFTLLPKEDPAPQATFDAERVYSAISSTALEEDSEQPWHTLPAKIAVDIFREILSNYNIDELYDILSDDPDSYPMGKIREKFSQRVRNTGILSYRLITHTRWQPLVDGIYNPSELRCSPVYNMPITPYKMLRERGIKVIAAGILELTPPDSVLEQRLESWGVPWAAQTEVQLAHYQLEIQRAYKQAYIEAQQDLHEEFDHLLANQAAQSDLPLEEIQAMQVLDALETLATEKETRKYLSNESINMMREINGWTLPNEDFGNRLDEGGKGK
jgi:hypothetical protein